MNLYTVQDDNVIGRKACDDHLYVFIQHWEMKFPSKISKCSPEWLAATSVCYLGFVLSQNQVPDSFIKPKAIRTLKG